MTVRTDIQVLPVYSPRVVLVESPSTEVVIQDLYDTLAAWQDSEDGHAYDLPIVTAGGKEDLGGGVSVGISATLQNAQLMFQARTTPVESGTVTTADPTGRVLTDLAADFVAAGLVRGDLVQNLTSGAKATVLTVATTALGVLFLEGGDDARFDLHDAYEAYHIHLCNISGGNLVAVDALGVTINSTLASFGTNIVRTSSSSATLQDLDAIQYASYQNSVWVDVMGTTTGTEYPSGTREFPVNNLSDAQAIALAKGFRTLQILRDTVVNTGLDLREFEFIGQSHVATHLTIESSALVEDISISKCNVSGVLDGGTHISNCMVGNLTYVNGHIHDCGLYGLIILDGDADAVIANCFTVDADSPPVIDMGGGGQDLAMPNYAGLITLRNLNDPTNEIGIGLNAGVVTLESTITAGSIIISGIGILNDFSVGSPPGLNINTEGLLNQSTIPASVWGALQTGHAAGTMGSAQQLLRKLNTNRLELADGSTNNWVLYDDDGVTPLLTWSVRDKTGSPIVQPTGAPSRRGAAT